MSLKKSLNGQDRPAWQRHALRRIVLNGELSDDDIRDLSGSERKITAQ